MKFGTAIASYIKLLIRENKKQIHIYNEETLLKRDIKNLSESKSNNVFG